MIVSHPCTHRDEFCIPKENESNISRRVHCGAILKEEYQEAMKKTIAIVLSRAGTGHFGRLRTRARSG